MWKLFVLPEIQTHKRRLIYIRPIFLISSSFMAGIWVSYFLKPSFFPFFTLAFFVLFVSFFQIRKPAFILFSALIFFLMGILFGVDSRTLSKSDIAFNAAEGAAVLDGRVVSVPEKTVNGKKETFSFVLEADNFFRQGKVFKSRGKVQVFVHNVGREIRYGDEMRLKGRFEPSKPARNPHVFDYGAYLSKNGIHKIFRAIGRYSVLRQQEGSNDQVILIANHFRIFLKERIEKLLPHPYHELANALLFGFKKNIPREIKDTFIKTGTAHLLAISGLNITLVAGFFYFLVSFLRMPRSINLTFTIFFIALYVILAGADPPVLRAGLMGVSILFGFLIERERQIKSALFLAFFILLIVNPKVLFLASFQLSFVAAAALIFLLPVLEKNLFFSRPKRRAFDFAHPTIWMRFSRFMAQTFMTSFAATIGMFPILIWYFNQFSFTGFLANAVAIPVCTLGIAATLLVLLIDLTGFPFTHFFAFIPIAILDCELKVVRWFSELPFGYFYLPKPGWIFFISYYGFLAAWLIFSTRSVLPKWRRTCLSGLILTVAIFLLSSHPPKSRFLFFDLGKTDAAFVSFSNGARFLINAGRHFPGDQAYWILRPYLMASGIRKLDGVLVTKPDAAHAGGFKTLTYHVGIRNVWIPIGSDGRKRDRYINPSFSKHMTVTSLSAGDRVYSGADRKTYIQILDAKNGEIGAFLISDQNGKILYVSASREETFKTLLFYTSIQYDAVFLAHLDSGISDAQEEFLKRLSTRYLILNQRDGLAQIRSYVNAPILSISEMGAIEFSFQKDLTYRTFQKPGSEELLTLY